MSYADQQYHTLLQELVDLAESTPATNNRTDTDAFTLFGRQMRFDLSQGFPLLTTKKVHFNSVLTELLWFLKGDTNIKYLLERNNHIWTDWRYKVYLQDHAKRTTTNSPKPLSMAEFENLLITDPTIAEAYGDIGKEMAIKKLEQITAQIAEEESEELTSEDAAVSNVPTVAGYDDYYQTDEYKAHRAQMDSLEVERLKAEISNLRAQTSLANAKARLTAAEAQKAELGLPSVKQHKPQTN